MRTYRFLFAALLALAVTCCAPPSSGSSDKSSDPASGGNSLDDQQLSDLADEQAQMFDEEEVEPEEVGEGSNVPQCVPMTTVPQACHDDECPCAKVYGWNMPANADPDSNLYCNENEQDIQWCECPPQGSGGVCTAGGLLIGVEVPCLAGPGVQDPFRYFFDYNSNVSRSCGYNAEGEIGYSVSGQVCKEVGRCRNQETGQMGATIQRCSVYPEFMPVCGYGTYDLEYTIRGEGGDFTFKRCHPNWSLNARLRISDANPRCSIPSGHMVAQTAEEIEATCQAEMTTQEACELYGDIVEEPEPQVGPGCRQQIEAIEQSQCNIGEPCANSCCASVIDCFVTSNCMDISCLTNLTPCMQACQM